MNINQPLARLVIRDEGKDHPPVLGLLSCLRGQTFFEKGMVYEVRETLDTITIVKIGPSAVAGTGSTIHDSPIYAHWGWDVGSLLSRGPILFLTHQEAVAMRPCKGSE